MYPGKQLGDQIRTAHDILVGVVGICDTERCCGGRHQLHDTDGAPALLTALVLKLDSALAIDFKRVEETP